MNVNIVTKVFKKHRFLLFLKKLNGDFRIKAYCCNQIFSLRLNKSYFYGNFRLKKYESEERKKH